MLEFNVRPDYQAILAERGIRGLRLPDRMKLDPAVQLEGPCFLGANISLATPVSVGAFTMLNGGRISAVNIGRYCSFAPDVVFGADEHPVDRATSSSISYNPGLHGWDQFYDRERSAGFRRKGTPFANRRKMTHVGHDVWIGMGAFIRSGVTIGTGSIIGARTVVVSDVPPYSILAGVPGRVKRLRFSERQVERLLDLKWWNYGIYEFLGEPMTNIDLFCDEVERRTIVEADVPAYKPGIIDAQELSVMIGVA